MEIPYCGSPPVPGAAAWNLDPALIGFLTAAAVSHLWFLRSQLAWRRAAAAAGWTIIALALVSPLCSLSVALFSARVGQHMLIALIGAPLIALGFERQAIAGRQLFAATAAFAVALWLWHMPGPYGATFVSVTVYWSMHLMMFGAALWLSVALLGSHPGPFPALAASFLTALQMTLLGALLTFSAEPWFGVHTMTTIAWGYSSLEDQQLGGLIMWVPAGLLLTGYAVTVFGLEFLTPSEER